MARPKTTPEEAGVLAKWKKAGRDDSILNPKEYDLLQRIPYEVRYPEPKDWYKKIPNISEQAQGMVNIGAKLFKAMSQSGVAPKITVPPLRSVGAAKLRGLKSPIGYTSNLAPIPLSQVGKREGERQKQKAANWKEVRRTVFGEIKSNISDIVSPEAKTLYDKLSGNEDILGFKMPWKLPQLAKGGLVKKTGVVQVHAGEVVTPHHKAFAQEVKAEEHNKRVIEQDRLHHKEQVKKLDEQTTLLKSLGEQTKILKSIERSIKNISGTKKGTKKDTETTQKRTPSLREEYKEKIEEKKRAVKEKAKGWFRSKVGSKYAPKPTIAPTTQPAAEAAEGGGLADFATNMGMYELAKKGLAKVGGLAGSALGYLGGAAVAGPAALIAGMGGLAYMDYKRMQENPEAARLNVESGFGSAEGALTTAWMNAQESDKEQKQKKLDMKNEFVKAQEEFLRKNPGEKNAPVIDTIENTTQSVDYVKDAIEWLADIWESVRAGLTNVPVIGKFFERAPAPGGGPGGTGPGPAGPGTIGGLNFGVSGTRGAYAQDPGWTPSVTGMYNELASKYPKEMTPEQVKEYITSKNKNIGRASPILGHEQEFLDMAKKAGIDPRTALAVWQKETQLGTTGFGPESFQFGNMKAPGDLGYATGAGGVKSEYGKYSTPQAGMQAWFDKMQKRKAMEGGPPVAGVEQGGSPFVRETQQGATRSLPITPELRGQLAAAGASTGLIAEVFSGGQPVAGGQRVGGNRHNLGNAADIHLRDETGRVLSTTNPADQQRISEYIKMVSAAGATGIGAGPGYMGGTGIHVGGGLAGSWGASTRFGSAPEYVEKARLAGIELRKQMGIPTQTELASTANPTPLDVYKSMSGPVKELPGVTPTTLSAWEKQMTERGFPSRGAGWRREERISARPEPTIPGEYTGVEIDKMAAAKAATKAVSVPAGRAVGGVMGGTIAGDTAGAIGSMVGKVLPFVPHIATKALGAGGAALFDTTPAGINSDVVPEVEAWKRRNASIQTSNPVGEALSVNATKTNIIESTKLNQGQQMVKGLEELQANISKISSGGQTNIIQSGGNAAPTGDWPPTYFADDPIALMAVGILNLTRGIS